MKIAHHSDWHVDERHRLDDVLRCLDFVVNDGIAQGVDLWLVTGDLSGKDAPHIQTPHEQLVIAERVQAMANHAPVIVIPGNHDTLLDLVLLRELRATHAILVPERPTSLVPLPGVRVFCLPYPSKRYAVASGAVSGGLVTEKAEIEGYLRTILDDWRREAIEAHAQGELAVGAMHINIGGSALGGGERIHIGREIELSPHDLTELHFDAGCLGHIHRKQTMAPGWGYAGDLTPLDHGEAQDEKSYRLLELHAGQPLVETLRPTPARRLVTVRMEWGRDATTGGAWGWVADDMPAAETLADADVRLQYRVPEEARGTVTLDTVLATLARDGARVVVPEPEIIPTVRVRSEAIATATTTAAKVEAFWETLGADAPDAAQRERCLALLPALEAPDATEEAPDAAHHVAA